MARNGRHDDIVGLDIGAGELKVAVVRNEQVVRIGHAPLPAGVIVDGYLVNPDRLVVELRKLWKKLGLKSRRVSFSVAHRRVIYRAQALPRTTNPDNLQLAIVTNAEVWFAPMHLDEMVIDYIERPAGQKMELELCAAEKELVASYVKALRRARLVTVSCQFGPLAEAKTLVLPRSAQTAQLVVNVGAEKTTIAVTNGTDVLFVRLIEIGGNDFTRAIQKKLDCSFADAEYLKRAFGLTGTDPHDPDLVAAAQEAMLEPLDRLVQALADSRAFFVGQLEGPVPAGVTVLGGGARLTGLRQQISLYLQFPEISEIEPRDAFANVPDFDMYAGAVALAWQQPMSLLPQVVGAAGDKGPVRSKVDRRKAARIAKRLRKSETKAVNPLFIAVGIGALLLVGQWYYGGKMKTKNALAVEAVVAPVDPTYSDPAVTRAFGYLRYQPPMRIVGGVDGVMQRYHVRSLLYSPSNGKLSVSGTIQAKRVDDVVAALGAAGAIVENPPVGVGNGPANQTYNFNLTLGAKP
jgi:type IV pilus assembly protein PilM